MRDTEKNKAFVEKQPVSEISSSAISIGQEYLEQYMELTVSELLKSEDKKTKTAIVRKMMEISGTSITILAKYLACQEQSLRNKMFRNSFSIDDLVIAAYACNFSIIFKDKSSNQGFEIGFEDYFKDYNDDVLKRVSDISEARRTEKREEYLQLKEQLEKMKREYGFDE